MQKRVELLIDECQRSNGVNKFCALSICYYKVATKDSLFSKVPAAVIYSIKEESNVP
jgi:hypothetical protein